MIVLKAMGLESDQEAVQLVGPDPAYASLLAPSLQECASHGVFTQQQALEYCGAKVRTANRMAYSRSKRNRVDEARDILAGVVLAHVPVTSYDFRQKCARGGDDSAHIARDGGQDAVDDKDYYGNKRRARRTTSRCSSRIASNDSTRILSDRQTRVEQEQPRDAVRHPQVHSPGYP